MCVCYIQNMSFNGTELGMWEQKILTFGELFYPNKELNEQVKFFNIQQVSRDGMTL